MNNQVPTEFCFVRKPDKSPPRFIYYNQAFDNQNVYVFDAWRTGNNVFPLHIVEINNRKVTFDENTIYQLDLLSNPAGNYCYYDNRRKGDPIYSDRRNIRLPTDEEKEQVLNRFNQPL